ncbi:MAG: autotransporter-associated beta strand repeat-containing protein [Thermoguttaceae bacterium]|nr:autotransporter-associated beta strand repeat-containing protein [Thermoguttaceae bacterium]
MTNPKTFVRVSSVLLAAVLAWSGLISTVYAESISINFGADKGTPSNDDTVFGVISVSGKNWNNASGASGTINLKNDVGAATGVSGTWECSTTYNGGTFPSRDNNAILFYGYLDDGAVNSHNAYFSMTAPYFSYDIYYYAATDVTSGSPHRYATINNVNYCGGSNGTVTGTSSWGTPVTGNISASDLKEGVNYLKVSSSDPEISIYGAPKSGNYRGSFGAVQIVNTYNSQSTTTSENSLTLANATWNNDLTGATDEGFNDSAYGYRILYTGTADTFTVDLGGATTNLPNIRLIGAATNLAFTGTVSQLGKTNTVLDFSKVGAAVTVPNFAQVAPRGVVKFNSAASVSFTEAMTDKDVIPGAYYVDGTTVSYASIVDGVITATETTTTIGEKANLLVTAGKDDHVIRTLNSLITQADYRNNQSLTISSGMMTLRSANHWVQGGGTITSGNRNANGEYDLYICGLGDQSSLNDMRINESTIVDNPSGKLNVIKTGTGLVCLSRAKNPELSYTGKTSVLEGKLQIVENVRSTEFFIASDAALHISSSNYKLNSVDLDLNITATSLSGYGTLEIGNNNGLVTLTLNNVVNDGSKFARVNAYGKDLKLNNSQLHATFVDNNSVITLTNSTLATDTLNGSATSKVVITGNSSLNVGNIAGTVTLEIPENETQTFNTAITGAGGFVKAGEGTLKLTANNAYSGNTIINGGVLDLTEGKLYSGAYFSKSDFYVNAGGTLKVNNFGYNQNENRASLGGLAYNDGTTTRFHMNGGTVQITESYGSPVSSIGRKIELQTNGGTLDLAEGVELVLDGNIHGVGALTKAGAGTLELTYANEYADGTTISQGEVNLSGSGSLGTGAVAIAQNAVLNLNHDSNVTFNNSVTGVAINPDDPDSAVGYGKIYKNGNGVLKILNNTQDGFVVESFVVSSGELDFKGYFKGSLDIEDGAVFSPGNSVGTIYETGDFILETGAKLFLEVGSQDGQTAGDLLQVAGTATFAQGSIVEIGLDETSQLKGGDEFELVMITADSFGDGFNIDDFNKLLRSYYITDLKATYNGDSSPKTITISGRLDPNAVPEPSTWALLILGALGLLYWRKKNA